MMGQPKKSKHNTLRLLVYFQNKFQQTYTQPYQVVPGKDLTVMKRIKVLFETNPQLGDLYSFIDFCLQQNPNRPVGTPYLLKVAQTKLGVVPKQNKIKTIAIPDVVGQDVLDWIKAERERVGKLNNKSSDSC